jgi:hypothetical protein
MVIKEGHEEEERMSPPAALQLLFQKQAYNINPKKLKWSRYTQEQAQRGGRIGGRASVETNGEQMRNVGRASCAAQSKATPTDPDYLMTDGTKPKYQLQETCSIGGRIGGRASVESHGEHMGKGGLAGGPVSFAAQSKAAPTDTSFLVADGTKPKNQWQQTQSSGSSNRK